LPDTAVVATSADRRESPARLALVFTVAFAVALVGAVTLKAGPKFTAGQEAIGVPASAMQVVRGRGHLEGERLVLDGLDADRTAVAFATTTPFAAADHTRAIWRLSAAAPPGAQLGMVWRTREEPRRTFMLPLETTRGSIEVDLSGQPGWKGTIVGVGLGVRGALDAPLPIEAFEVRSNAWTTTLAEVLRDWGESPYGERRTAIAQLSFEERHVAPFVAVVAAALALALAWLAFRGRRRGTPVASWAFAALFLAAWLAVDLRWQTLMWREHAAAWAAFAGKPLDGKLASMDDAAIFEVARKVRDAPRPRNARILVVADSSHLRQRVAWFLYPENVYAPSDLQLRGGHLAPGQLRAGDQVLLLLTRAIAWDRDRQLLVWPDGATRAGREILSDGPALSFVEVAP